VAGFAFVKMEEAKEQTTIAEQAKNEAEEQAQIALIEKLGAQSIVATQNPSPSNGSYEHAVLLSVQAFKEEDNRVSRSNLLRVFQAKKQRKVFLYGYFSSVKSVTFSPDGKTLVHQQQSIVGYIVVLSLNRASSVVKRHCFG